MQITTIMNSLNIELQSFQSTYYSEDNQEILNQYLSIKSSLLKHPDLQISQITYPEFYLYDEEFRAIQSQTSYLLSSNWKDVVRTDDLSIQTSRGQTEFLTKLQFNVDARPIEVFSVLYETEITSDWMKTMKDSTILRKISPHRKVVQNFYKLPWPLVNRHSIINVRYIPMPELKTILTVAYTPELHMSSPVNFDKYIEMVLPSASIWLKCVGNQTELTIIIQANKYIGMIPSWLVNFMITRSFTETVKDFRSLFPIFSETKYYEAITKTNQSFYSSISQQMNLPLH